MRRAIPRLLRVTHQDDNAEVMMSEHPVSPSSERGWDHLSHEVQQAFTDLGIGPDHHEAIVTCSICQTAEEQWNRLVNVIRPTWEKWGHTLPPLRSAPPAPTQEPALPSTALDDVLDLMGRPSAVTRIAIVNRCDNEGFRALAIRS